MKKIILVFFSIILTNFSSAQISITFTNVVQPCTNNGSVSTIVTGGTAPYTYTWHQYFYYPFLMSAVYSTSPNISGLPPAYYFLTVKDALNQIAKDSIYMPGVVYFLNDTLLTPALPYYGIIAGVVCPNPNTALTFTIGGGNAPYTFSLGTVGTQTTSSTIESFTVPIGTYTCIVTDNSGCTATCNANVNVTPAFTVATSTTPDTCALNGTATATVTTGGTPPYSYSWNTTPVQTTPTITGLAGNSFYMVTVTDANNCTNYRYVSIPLSLSVHSIQSTANIKDATCGLTDGYIAVHDSGGVPPYTYQWNTGATTDSIYNLAPNTYTLWITDAAGCHEQFIKTVNPVSPILVSPQITKANCMNNGGADSVQVYGGMSPYTYQWSNGATTPYISNVSSGWYSVLVTDVNGCLGWSIDSVGMDSTCVAYIQGTVFNDMNGNCALDYNESGLPQQIIQSNTGYMCSSDWYGNYSLPIINPVGTYTISQTTKALWTQVCPSTAIILNPVGGNIYNYDFYDQPVPLINDLEVYIQTDSCRPGFTFNQWVSIFNKGTSTMTGTATLQHDALLNVISSGGASYNSSGHTFTFNFYNLAPMTWTSFNVQLQAPSGSTLFTPLTSYAVANPVSGDTTPNDNYDTLHYRVTGSWDPNTKSVTPKGSGANGNISTADSVLAYTIHFQNTGSYPTAFVSIIDTIDSNLDIFSLKITGYSDVYYPQISFLSINVIKFTFPNLQLKPASWDLTQSSGFISYTIHLKKNLPLGAQIKNRADIYFDYNSAILTNTILNTIATVGIENISNKQTYFVVYPNPTNGALTIKCDIKNARIKIIDVIGNVVKQLQAESEETTMDISNLQNGVYFVSVQTLLGVSTKKIVIQH
jgi:hypothetical protein